jgi:hypothetical protein
LPVKLNSKVPFVSGVSVVRLNCNLISFGISFIGVRGVTPFTTIGNPLLPRGHCPDILLN